MAAIFAELKKLIPTVQADDYKKNGVWQEEIMKLDAELVRRHREEAGAPEVQTTLEEYVAPAPDVWEKKTLAVAGNLAASLAAAKAAQAAQAAKAATAATNGLPAGMPAVAKASTTTAAAGAAAASANQAASDLRQIAVFVAQWKLDPTRTKLLLAKLTPPKRRWVMQHFRCPTATNGVQATAALENYIQQCEQTNLWKDAEQLNASPSAAATAAAGGVKRPVPGTSTPAEMAAKIPKLAAMAGMRPAMVPAMQQMAAKMGAMQQQMGGWRPGMPKPGMPTMGKAVGARPGMRPGFGM